MENGNMINKKEGVRLRAVAFDMDGVLLSTDKLHFKAWQEFTHRHGIPFTEADNARLLGLSRMDSMNIVLLRAQRAYTMEEKVALCEEKNELYRSLIATLTPDFVAPEVCRCLRMLRDDGWKLALASSSKNAPLILERTELRRYFDAKVDGNDITHGKPHPEVFVKAAEALGIPPEYCAAVDDAPAGIASALAAGMVPVATGEAALRHAAPYSISSLAELPILLSGLNAASDSAQD